MNGKEFADAHMHIVDVIEQGGYPDMDQASLLLSCTSSFSQWEPQTELRASDPRIFPFYGIHPWYVKDAPPDYIELLRRTIEENNPAGIGEIGLDSLRPDMNLQKDIFESQLRLASEMHRPATIHMIRSEVDTLKIMRQVECKIPMILHSYSGPDSYVKAFTAEGCYFSLSHRIFRRSDVRIMRLLSEIPDDRLLIETDAPICSHTCGNMSEFITSLAGLKSMDREEFIELTSKNARKVIG